MAIIDKPSDYFNTKLYTGDGNSTQAITGVGHQPDLVWLKNRSDGTWHQLIDAVRGTGATYTLASNSNEAEGGGATNQYGFISAIGSDGFTVSAGSSNASVVNHNGNNYASWNWKAGTSFTNDASATGIGTIDSSGSVNDTAGFSIVSYTGNGSSGATIKHGLSTAPKIIIAKNRQRAADWLVFSSSMSSNGDYALFLQSTSAKDNSQDYWGDTAPTSSVFSVGNRQENNQSGENIIAYCFAEKQGYSKFGSYLGFNSGAYGPFIYTGFKPAFVLIKDSSAANAWTIRDDKRNTFNPATNFLMPDASDAEVTAGEAVDILSNGFKIKANGGKVQDSGNTYIYMAFAENPFVASNFVPATAR